MRIMLHSSIVIKANAIWFLFRYGMAGKLPEELDRLTRMKNHPKTFTLLAFISTIFF